MHDALLNTTETPTMRNKQMTPREALYHVCLELGPIPASKRNDNLTPKEARLRDAIIVLKDCILETEENNEIRYGNHR